MKFWCANLMGNCKRTLAKVRLFAYYSCIAASFESKTLLQMLENTQYHTNTNMAWTNLAYGKLMQPSFGEYVWQYYIELFS